jgi:archaellum component FlaF (FlaF/FlaG flagellin family)
MATPPVKASHTKRNVAVVVVILLILILAGAAYKPSPETTTPSVNSTTASTPEEQYDVTIRYTERYQESIGISDAKPGYTYLILTMEIHNNIDRGLTIGPSYFYATTNNVKYDYSGATFWLNDALSCCPQLQKDGEISGSVAFEVPVGTTEYIPSYETLFTSWNISWVHYVNLRVTSTQAQEQLILESYGWDFGSNTITGSFRNVGSQAIDLSNAKLAVNGIYAGNPGGNCITQPLAPNSACMFSITVPNSTSWVSGAAYPLQIVTPAGSVFSYSVIAGGRS